MSKTIRKILCIVLSISMCLMTIGWFRDDVVYGDESGSMMSSTYMSGDLDGDKVVRLEDAQLALQAALKIISLEPVVLQVADLFGDGRVTLDDAQNILMVALKIKTMDEILGGELPISSQEPTMEPTELPEISKPTIEPTEPVTEDAVELPENFDYEAYVEEYLNMAVKMDKDIYHPGDNVKLTITVTNEGVYPIYMWNMYKADRLSNVSTSLKDASGSVITEFEWFPENAVEYRKVLSPGESITVQRIRTFFWEYYLESGYNEDWGLRDVVAAISFQYTNQEWEHTSSKYYKKIVPVPIEPVANCEAYIEKYLNMDIKTDKEVYYPGEEVRLAITVTNDP